MIFASDPCGVALIAGVRGDHGRVRTAAAGRDARRRSRRDDPAGELRPVARVDSARRHARDGPDDGLHAARDFCRDCCSPAFESALRCRRRPAACRRRSWSSIEALQSSSKKRDDVLRLALFQPRPSVPRAKSSAPPRSRGWRRVPGNRPVVAIVRDRERRSMPLRDADVRARAVHHSRRIETLILPPLAGPPVRDHRHRAVRRRRDCRAKRRASSAANGQLDDRSKQPSGDWAEIVGVVRARRGSAAACITTCRMARAADRGGARATIVSRAGSRAAHACSTSTSCRRTTSR